MLALTRFECRIADDRIANFVTGATGWRHESSPPETRVPETGSETQRGAPPWRPPSPVPDGTQAAQPDPRVLMPTEN